MNTMKIFGYAALLSASIYTTSCDGSAEKKEEATTAAANETPSENGAAVIIADANGSLTLNAENGIPIGPSIKYMPEFKAYGWFRNLDKVEWDIDVKTAGTYKATLEWSVSDEEAGKEFVVEAGAAKLTGTVAKSGSWETFKSAEIGTINLAGGRQKLVFRANKDFDSTGALLDLRQLILQPETK